MQILVYYLSIIQKKWRIYRKNDYLAYKNVILLPYKLKS